MRQVERWARKTQIANILSFFDDLPRFVKIPNPLLLGSNNNEEILVHGELTTHSVRRALASLDEPFNPNLKFQKTICGEKRNEPVGAMRPIHQQLPNGFPELCLLKGNGQCGPKIVRAHSIQKALFKGHAKQGHIYQFEVLNGTQDADKRLWPDLIGVNLATTFTGFCDYHDSHTFVPIENSPFSNTSEQRFLYHYRAFAQTYYGRAHRFRIIEDGVKELSKTVPVTQLKKLIENVKLNQQDVKELEPQGILYEQHLQKRQWDAVQGHAFLGDGMPDILTTEFFAPHKDFQGRIIQDCKSWNRLHWVSMTVTASLDRAVVLLCAEKGSPILHQLFDSLRKLPPDSRTRALVGYTFCHFENFILLPQWWESLSKPVQLKFVNAFAGRYYPRELPNTCDWKLNELTSQN